MEKIKPAIDGAPVAAPTDDAEAKFAALEAEKAKLIEERENYKVAFLKERQKGKHEDVVVDESEDEKLRRLIREEAINSNIAQLARDQDALLKQALKENKELKLARSKPNDPPAGMGSHSESTPVKDTLITNDQLLAFKQRGWTDKDIERYKKNLNRYGGR